MGSVILISGPVGAGKTTVARLLASEWPGTVSHIEGDTFWSFIAKPAKFDRLTNFGVIMRSMTAAALPFARSGYDVVLDFSIPPYFLETARKILKEVPLRYVMLLPSEAICVQRAAARREGIIKDYARFHDFYQLFTSCQSHAIDNGEADAAHAATQVRNALDDGQFRVG